MTWSRARSGGNIGCCLLGSSVGNVSVLVAGKGKVMAPSHSFGVGRPQRSSNRINNKTLVIIYLPVNAGGGTREENEECHSERTRGAHITNEIYDGYDTKWVDIHTQNTEKAPRKRKRKKGSWWDSRWIRTLLGVVPRRGLASTIVDPIHGRCIWSGLVPILIPPRIMPSAITVPCGVVIHRRL